MRRIILGLLFTGYCSLPSFSQELQVKVIKKQLRNEDQPWLQNKAANDLLNYGKSQIYGDEERTVHVQIDGLPDIGSPDDD